MKHSLTNRLKVGVLIGFFTGGLVFFLAPLFGLVFSTALGAGLWIFYVILGLMTGFLGLFEQHPILKFPTPFWLRGMVIGVVMHLMLVLLTYDQMAEILHSMDFMGLQSPFWALIDGLILGVLMSWLEAKYAGEGTLPLK